MPNWCTNIILISGPIEDVSVLYKSLEEYKAEVKAKEKEEKDVIAQQVIYLQKI